MWPLTWIWHPFRKRRRPPLLEPPRGKDAGRLLPQRRRIQGRAGRGTQPPAPILRPGPALAEPAPGITITAAGYVEGLFHLQVLLGRSITAGQSRPAVAGGCGGESAAPALQHRLPLRSGLGGAERLHGGSLRYPSRGAGSVYPPWRLLHGLLPDGRPLAGHVPLGDHMIFSAYNNQPGQEILSRLVVICLSHQAIPNIPPGTSPAPASLGRHPGPHSGNAMAHK